MGTIGASRKGVVCIRRASLGSSRQARVWAWRGGCFCLRFCGARSPRPRRRSSVCAWWRQGAGRGRVGVVAFVVLVVVSVGRTDAEILDASARVRVLTKLNELAWTLSILATSPLRATTTMEPAAGTTAVVHDALHVKRARETTRRANDRRRRYRRRDRASPRPRSQTELARFTAELAVATRSTRVDAAATGRLSAAGRGRPGFTVVGFADAIRRTLSRARRSVSSHSSLSPSVVRTASFASRSSSRSSSRRPRAAPPPRGEELFQPRWFAVAPVPPSSRSAGISMIFLRLGVSVDALACRANPRRRQWRSFSNHRSARARGRSSVVASSPASSRETHLTGLRTRSRRLGSGLNSSSSLESSLMTIMWSIDRNGRHRLTTRPSRSVVVVARASWNSTPGEIVISSVPGLGFAVDIVELAPNAGARAGRCARRAWSECARALPSVRAMCVALAKRGYRAITFDLRARRVRGRGERSRYLRGRRKPAGRALEAAGAAAAMVVGSSMGGALAIYIVNSMREMGDVVVERVVLINPLLKMKTYVPGAALAALRLCRSRCRRSRCRDRRTWCRIRSWILITRRRNRWTRTS